MEAVQENRCFACGQVYWVADGDKSDPGSRCSRCGWGRDGNPIPDEDPRHLIMFSLVERAEKARTNDPKNTKLCPECGLPNCGNAHDDWLRLNPSDREYAMLEKGDQIKTCGEVWRITTKNEGILWLRRFGVEKAIISRLPEAVRKKRAKKSRK